MFEERTHFYCSFSLRNTQDRQESWNYAIQTIRAWLTMKLRHWSKTADLPGEWFVKGTEQARTYGRHIIQVRVSTESRAGIPALWSLRYQHDDTNWHYRKWKTEISLRSTEEEICFTLKLSHSVEGDWVGEEPQPTHSIPGLVAAFLKSGRAFSGGVKLRDIPITVKAADAALFRDFLASKNRVLPIVLVSRNVTGDTLVNAKVLARALASIAFVCIVADGAADYALSQVLSKEFRTFGGAVRLYQPGVRLDELSDAFRHRYFRYDDPDISGSSVESLILRAVLRGVSSQHARGLVTVHDVQLQNAVVLARSQGNTEALSDALQARIEALEKTNEEQYEEYCHAVARRDEAEGELRDIRDELKQKNYQISELRKVASRDSEQTELDPLDSLKEKLKLKSQSQTIIGIRSKQDPSFYDAVAEQFGVMPSDLSGLVTEDIREHSSNLVTNLTSSYSGRVVLYAHGHLKYMSPEEKKNFAQFFQAGKVRDAVTRFAQWLDG